MSLPSLKLKGERAESDCPSMGLRGHEQRNKEMKPRCLSVVYQTSRKFETSHVHLN